MTDTITPAPAPALGTLWEIKAKTAATITRPDGSQVMARSDGKTATHVLDVPGTYAAAVDGKTVTILAG